MIRRLLSVLALMGFAGGLLVANAVADKETDKPFEATCVVSGAPAKKENAEKYMGKQVYFCCENCPKAFKADPKKFDLKAKLQWLETSQITQVACPLSGKPVDAKMTSQIGKATVAFCCEKCKGAVDKADDKAKLVFGDFDKGFTLQTSCPVSGKPLNVAQVVEHEGKKVYFCCPGCPDPFKKEPAKYMAKLPQFAKEENK
jgi:YHS domain-containing protein